MHIDVPTTWDSKLLRMLAEQSRAGHSFQLYGALPFSFPTGRPDDVPTIGKESAIGHFREAKALGFETNYLINGAKGSRFFAEQGQTVREYIEWVTQELRPDLITISDPDLQIILNLEFGWEAYCISAIAGIRDESGLMRWLEHTKDNGHVSSVVLHHDVTQRSYAGISTLARAAQDRNVRPKLMVTESCYGGCKVRQAHYGFVSQPSGTRPRHDPFQMSCMMKRLVEPASLLDLAGFISPDEISAISAITGVDSFKITGRSCSAEWIARACKHYCSGQSPINLFELIVFTAPLLRETLGIKVEELFHLDSGAYLRYLQEIRSMLEPERQAFRRKTARDWFQSGLLRINDPGGTYEVIAGTLQQSVPGTYFSALERQFRACGGRQNGKIAEIVIDNMLGSRLPGAICSN